MNVEEMREKWNKEIEKLVKDLDINEDDLECFKRKYILVQNEITIEFFFFN